MLNVTLYYSKLKPEYEDVVRDLEQIQETIPHLLVMVDIDQDIAFKEDYQLSVPVIIVGPYKLQWPITKPQLLVALGAARDRNEHLEKIGDKVYEERKAHSQNWSKVDQFALWFSKHYMLVFNFILFLYVGIPFLAPVFLKANMPIAAKVVYTIYKPLCHQLPFRSFFLFGDQIAYPRELAGISDLKTYEEITGNDPLDLLAARNYVGDEHYGFKIALCERDIAIWGSLLLFGLIFSLSKQRIKALPLFIWLALGVVPMGLDGGSQLLGLLVTVPEWLPARESTPLLRLITGALFGLTTAWFVFPLMEENMRDTRKILMQKVTALKTIPHDEK